MDDGLNNFNNASMLRNGGVPLGGSNGGGFDDGSQTSSELDFGNNPGNMSIDTMMAADMGSNAGMMYGGPAPASAGQNLQSYGGNHDFVGGNVLVGGGGGAGAVQHDRHRGSFSSLADRQSPIGAQPHRLSIDDTSPYSQRHGNNVYEGLADSDTTSPGAAAYFAPDAGGRDENTNPSMKAETSTNNNNPNNPAGEDNSNPNSNNNTTALPSWSELKTKAGKERKRLPLACIACRRKKIRCSGEKPACKHCLRSRIPCVYKVTTRKAAPRTDYMAMLDKRLKRMEDRVIKLIPRQEQDAAAAAAARSVERAVVKPALPPAPPRNAGAGAGGAGGSKKRGAVAAFTDELDEWAEASTAAATTTTTTTNATQTTQQQGGEKAADGTMKAQDIEEQNLLKEGADKLPPKEVQEHLSEVFFDFVYGQGYHLLHKPSFMRKLNQGTVPPVLMLAVCAISARFSNHPVVRTEPAFLRGEEWATVAREISLRRYDTPNITILIVYLILGLHEFGTCQGGRSWMFGGMAQRMAYALQLHKDLDHDPRYRHDGEKSELTFTDREIRRRTMWSCFLMDRFNSSGTDRPIFIGEQYIRAQLPIKERYYQMEISASTEDLEGNIPNPTTNPSEESGQMNAAKQNMGVAAYQIRLIAIWGKLVNYLNLGGKERDAHPMWHESSILSALRRAAREWRETLPESLRYSRENLQTHASEKIANQFLFLHICYHQVMLFMHRFALPIPGSRVAIPQGMPQEFLSEAVRAAHEAANSISALINDAMDHNVVAPFAGYCAFFSSTVHVYGAFSGKAALKVSSKQNLAYNVKYLTKMKKYWGMFHFVTENLRDLYRKHADAARSGSNSNSANSNSRADSSDPAAIFQYGDWFDRYPHGVSGTDYEEPNSEVKKEPGADAVLGQKSDLQTVEEFFSKLTPPTRGAQMQQQLNSQGTMQQQQRQQRKTARTKRSKSESKGSAEAGAQRAEVIKAQQQQLQQQQQPHQHQQRQQQSQQPLTAMQGSADQQQQASLDPQAVFAPNIQGYAHQQQQPQSFQQQRGPYQNPMMMNPQHFVPDMTLNSYSAANNTQHNNPHQQQQQQSPIDHFSFASPFGPPNNNNANANPHGHGSAAAANNLFWSDPSTTFFMPFNMDPPTIDSFDWSTGFGEGSGVGFGEFAAGGVGVGLGGTGTGMTTGVGPHQGVGEGGGEVGDADGGDMEGVL